ncbi:hypothetical protein [Bacillus xiapuensis]|uniref:Uncharacterized protein n=1 Tax=Bacillus xiapuensis TaxID=2014075 RepID=A0ABU6N6K0_9BACI|nr:hypothetical protein [Bacillus xiapuensis]
MFLRKDATSHLVIRVEELLRKTTIYAKIALTKNRTDCCAVLNTRKLIGRECSYEKYSYL